MWLMPTEHERSANYEFRLLRREEEEEGGDIQVEQSLCEVNRVDAVIPQDSVSIQ